MTRFKDIVEAVFPSVGKNDTQDDWSILCDLIENTPHGKMPRGFPEILDLIAQVLNGGIYQYTDNGYAKDDYQRVMDALDRLGPAGREVHEKLSDLSCQPDEWDEDNTTDDELEEFREDYDKFDTWFYKGADDRLVKEMLEKMRSL